MPKRETHLSPQATRIPRGLTTMLAINSVWMLIAAVGRVIIALHQGTLDALPFVSFALGAVGIAALAITWIRDRP